MNHCAIIIALLSTAIVLQPLALPILSAVRRKGPAAAFLWFLLSMLPGFAWLAIGVGLLVGWGEFFTSGPSVPSGEFKLFGPAEDIFTELAPILAACTVPSLMFVAKVLYDRRRRRLEDEQPAPEVGVLS